MSEPSHFNFGTFLRSGGRWPTGDTLTNGYTLEQLQEIRDILSTMTDDQIVSRYLSDPLPDYHITRGGDHVLDRASRLAPILPVTHSDINPSGLRELKISPTLGMGDGGEEKLVIRFARPYTFNLFAGDFQLFSDIEGRKVSCSVEEFDRTFTNASKDKDILFNVSSRWMFHRYEEKGVIKDWLVDSELDTDILLLTLLLQPIVDCILKQNIQAKTHVSSLIIFISQMMGLGRLGEPFTDEQLWRKLVNYKRAFRISEEEFQMVNKTINSMGNKEASKVLDDLSLNRLTAVITEKDEVGNYKLEGIVTYMVRSQRNLNMRGFNLRVDFAGAFMISPDDAEKLFLFNGISPSLRCKTLAIVPTILIESKHVFTRVPSLLLKILNDPTIKKHNMVGTILKKVARNISIEKTDLNGDCSSLDADLNEINEFMKKDHISLKNIGYSINKLIM